MAILKRLLVGRPLATVEQEHQRIPKTIGLAVFSSDAISSTAYATEEILFVTAVGASSLALGLDTLVPIGIAVAILLAIVCTSYRQTIFAYPSGGGSYIVSRENLGETPSLIAGGSLLVDYILTVAVSISAGVAAIISIPAFQGLATVAGLVKGGKLRLIAVTTPRRLPQFSDVPTVSESGLPGFEFNSWATVVAPSGTPKDIVARLNAEISKALSAPEVREKLIAQGLTPRGSSIEELRQATREQLDRYAALMKQAGIKLD